MGGIIQKLINVLKNSYTLIARQLYSLITLFNTFISNTSYEDSVQCMALQLFINLILMI